MENLNENTDKNKNSNKMEVEEYSDDEDYDYDKLLEEADKNIDVEFYDGEDPFVYDDIIVEEDNNNTNMLEEESFKNDEDYKKMIERKSKIMNHAFPDFEAEGEIYSIDVHDKLGKLIIGDGEEYTYLYDIENKKIISQSKVNKDSIISVKFSFDKSLCLTASMDGVIRIFKSENQELLHTIDDINEEIMWTDWHPRGNVFAFGVNSGSVYVYNAKDGENIMNLHGHADVCSAGQFSPDGKTLLTASNDKTVRVWELKNQCCKHVVRGQKFHKADILCMAVATKKGILATGSGFNELGLVNWESGTILHFFDSGKDSFSIECISFSNDDNFIVFSSTDNLIRVLELQKLTIRSMISLKDENITKMIPSNIHKHLVYMGTSGGKFLVYDSRSTKEDMLISEQVHCSGIMDFCVTKTEDYIFTSSLDRTINMVKLDPLCLGLEKNIITLPPSHNEYNNI